MNNPLPSQKLHFGTAYYAEHWPEEREKSFQLISFEHPTIIVIPLEAHKRNRKWQTKIDKFLSMSNFCQACWDSAE